MVRSVLALAAFFKIAGPMALVYLVANVAIVLSSFLPTGSPPIFVLLFTAYKLASLPRDRFVEKREPWSQASIGAERSLIIGAIILHVATCLATLICVWFFWPDARAAIPLTAGVAIATAAGVGTWKWLNARKAWSQYGLWNGA